MIRRLFFNLIVPDRALRRWHSPVALTLPYVNMLIDDCYVAAIRAELDRPNPLYEHLRIANDNRRHHFTSNIETS